MQPARSLPKGAEAGISSKAGWKVGDGLVSCDSSRWLMDSVRTPRLYGTSTNRLRMFGWDEAICSAPRPRVATLKPGLGSAAASWPHCPHAPTGESAARSAPVTPVAPASSLSVSSGGGGGSGWRGGVSTAGSSGAKGGAAATAAARAAAAMAAVAAAAVTCSKVSEVPQSSAAPPYGVGLTKREAYAPLREGASAGLRCLDASMAARRAASAATALAAAASSASCAARRLPASA
mmetsp:Transcript_32850/g.106205  ORF Transcript_32850/g.106205 Transcript_32850/m.106205 type:complete len:235 (-) Transcript_32850:4179-4883(-)|eukprot:scaffold9015_cov96-Isochrysis_galbana.AAC.3